MSQDNNQSAPLEDNATETVESGNKPVSDAAIENTTDKSSPKQIVDSSSINAPATDWKSQFEKIDKNYSELRREFTRRTQHDSDLQKKFDNLVEMFSKATEKPINPEQFIRDLQTQGPKALEPHFQSWLKPIKETYDKQLSDKDNAIFELSRDIELERRAHDVTNYPDFNKLRPIMTQIAEDENCPVNFAQAPGAILDALYKLARDRSAEQAVILAKEQGKKEAELQLAKESNSTIAKGGKSGGSAIPDWSKMSAEKMREVVANLHGIADRD